MENNEQQEDKIKSLLSEMFEAEESYGCGFYNHKRWTTPYNELKKIVYILNKEKNGLQGIYWEGELAGLRGTTKDANPHEDGTKEFEEWEDGRSDGEYEILCLREDN